MVYIYAVVHMYVYDIKYIYIYNNIIIIIHYHSLLLFSLLLCPLYDYVSCNSVLWAPICFSVWLPPMLQSAGRSNRQLLHLKKSYHFLWQNQPFTLFQARNSFSVCQFDAFCFLMCDCGPLCSAVGPSSLRVGYCSHTAILEDSESIALQSYLGTRHVESIGYASIFEFCASKYVWILSYPYHPCMLYLPTFGWIWW